jgi:ATP-binding cassette subfamily F protein 3
LQSRANFAKPAIFVSLLPENETVLSLENIGIEFGGRWLIREAGYQFRPGEKVGLIGRNGTGKSTLLKVIAGEMVPTTGQVHTVRGAKVAHYHQELLSFETEKSIFDLALEAFAPILEIKAEMEKLLARTEAGHAKAEDWDHLASLQAQFDAHDGSRMDASVHEMLSGLGFSADQHGRPYRTFSGGWRMRVLLARMLLSEPEILLLDEPTNHLDLPSIQWLENYLRTFRGICVLVSHDRFFIDRMADRILDISLQKMNVYNGNYTFYLAQKAERQELQKRAYDNQQKYIDEQERFINRFRAKATKARQVQSRIKQLDKIDLVEAPEEETVSLSIRFQVKRPSGKEVLTLEHIGKKYGDLRVLEDSSCLVSRGDKIALIGPNGIGKSTLLRVIAGLEPHTGKRIPGYQVSQTFFAQHQLEALVLENNIYEELRACTPGKTETELRTILGCFMFSGDDIEKKINVLSGGEKSRLALAKTLTSEANFLLLDEPTNHLDIPSIQILIQALQAYEGTFIVVSHDRHFLREVANKIWYISDRKLCEYPGTYAEFDDHLRRLEKDQKDEPQRKETEAPKSKGETDFKEQKRFRNRVKKLKTEIEVAEKEISKLEEEKKQQALRMAEPEIAADYGKLAGVQEKVQNLQKQIEGRTEDWTLMVMELEEMEAEES